MKPDRTSVKLMVTLAVLFVCPVTHAAEAGQPLFAKDDGIWVLFYDVSSRRFRSARDALVRRDFETARRDLTTSSGHLRLEAARADSILGERLLAVSRRLEEIAGGIEEPTVAVADLDPVYAGAHWLLTQQYLNWAERARDAGEPVEAGKYLWATVHHMERTVLWSNARVGKTLESSLEGMRRMAQELRTSKNPERVYKRKPIVQARNTLNELAKLLQLTVYGPAAT